MSGSLRYQPRGALARFVHAFEETAIAVLLGLMTMVTFVNVVMRYVFNTSLIWGLELVLIMFAWLVLLGIGYCVKVTAHLGVDAVTGLMRPRLRRWTALVAVAVSIFYAALLMKGAWDYWAPFAGLDATSGRWFPTGLRETRSNSFYVTDQVPLPILKDWLSRTFNSYEEGGKIVVETYEKMPRFIPYAMLPLGVALLLLRLVQAAIAIARGTRDSLIVSHEAEEAVEEAAARNAEI